MLTKALPTCNLASTLAFLNKYSDAKKKQTYVAKDKYGVTKEKYIVNS
jgi:hypothetical protein